MPSETSNYSPSPEGPRRRRVRTANNGFAADPALEKALDPLIDALSGADEERRQVAVARVLPRLPPLLKTVVAERLLRRLAGGDEVLQQQVRASVVSIGEPAALALQYHLIKAASVPLQVALVRILGAIVPGLSEQERMPVFGTLVGMLYTTPEEAVIEACMDATAPFREGQAKGKA